MTDRRVRMKRSTADRKLEAVKANIKAVNSDPKYCYIIPRAVVFGSYVNNPEYDTLGDLDVALELRPRYDGPEMESKENEARGRCPGSYGYIEYLAWPREEVLRAVRRSDRYVSIHIIGHDDEAIFSKDVLELEVDRWRTPWTSPQPTSAPGRSWSRTSTPISVR